MSDSKLLPESYQKEGPSSAIAPAVAVTADLVIDTLSGEYGTIRWEPRYEPISELVFTILSQHTSDVNSEKAFRTLLEAFGSWEAVSEAGLDEIARCIWIGGLSRVKAPRIKAVLTRVRELRGDLSLDFLRDMSLEEAKTWLRQLPGVGPKTAAVVLCFAMGMPAMPVDTHVHRVARRLGLIGGIVTAEKAHDLLESQVDPARVFPFHVYLITHGRRVCKAQRPRCHHCVMESYCPSSRLKSASQ